MVGVALVKNFLRGVAGSRLGEDLGPLFAHSDVDDGHAAEDTGQKTDGRGGLAEVGTVRPVEAIGEDACHTAGRAVAARKADLKEGAEQLVHAKDRREEERAQKARHTNLHKGVRPEPAKTGGRIVHHAGGVFRLLHTQHHACENDRDHVGRDRADARHHIRRDYTEDVRTKDHTEDTGKQRRGDEGLAEKRDLKTDDSADDQQNADDGNIVKKVTEGSARNFFDRDHGIFSSLLFSLLIK